jgi:hypothetical protein
MDRGTSNGSFRVVVGSSDRALPADDADWRSSARLLAARACEYAHFLMTLFRGATERRARAQPALWLRTPAARPTVVDGLQGVPVHSVPTLASIRKKRSLRRWASLRWVLCSL